MTERFLPLQWYTGSNRLSAQMQSNYVDFLDPRSFDLFTILLLGSGVILLLFFLFVVFRLFQKRLNFQSFMDQMKDLGLNEEEEGTFIYLVKRSSIFEPTRLITSPRVFDETASNEMFRVLAGDESQGTKEKFIDTVYKIRKVTHYPSRLLGDNRLE